MLFSENAVQVANYHGSALTTTFCLNQLNLLLHLFLLELLLFLLLFGICQFAFNRLLLGKTHFDEGMLVVVLLLARCANVVIGTLHALESNLFDREYSTLTAFEFKLYFLFRGVLNLLMAHFRLVLDFLLLFIIFFILFMFFLDLKHYLLCDWTRLQMQYLRGRLERVMLCCLNEYFRHFRFVWFSF